MVTFFCLGSLSGNMVGPNTLQKVMAGDQMSATVQYFFESAPGNSTPLTTMLLNTLGQLLSTGSQVGGLVKGNASAVTSQLSANPGFVNAVNPAQGGANTPQAYLTMVFFDERFEPIAEADGGVVRQQVAQSVGSGGSTLGLGNIKAPRNGYVLVYVSNSSEQPVYFDNLQVGKVNGNILEENHYYSFGLRISAISSRRFTDQYQGETKNGYLYQGAFAELDDDIGWQDFALRSYDAQIGRFMQMDPFSQFASHYTGMGNDPVNMIDPSGGIGIPCPGTSSLSIFFSTVGEGLMNIASSFSSGSSLIKLGVTAAHAGANVYRSVTQFNTVNNMMSVSLTSAVGSNTAIGRRFPIMLAESRKNGSGSGPDWDRNPDASGIRTDDLVGLTDEQLINEFRFTMNLYTRGVLDDVGNRIVDHFAQNTGKDFTDEILNNQIEASSAYQEKVKPLLANIQSEITRVKGDFLKYNKQVFNLPNFPTLSLNNSLKAIVGGTQYGNIILTKFTYDSKSGKFSGEINITIIDDFGVSKSDILKAKDTPFSKGLRAMWYLQHVRGYKPFRTVFSRNFRMTF